MGKCVDTYKEVKVFEFPNMIAKIHIPDLTPEERSKRMKNIHDHAARLLKGGVVNVTN